MQKGSKIFSQISAAGSLAWLLLAVLASLVSGCGPEKPLPPAPPAATPSVAIRPVLTVHSIGTTRLAQDPNAASPLGIWKLPASERLERQTLDKLARALPAILGDRRGADTNALSQFLRPLLDDVVSSESFFELWSPTNQPAEFALAVRLAAERTALWQSNVVAFNEASSVGPTNAGLASSKLQLRTIGDWVVLGRAATDSAGFTNFTRRIVSGNPALSDTNWIAVQADLGFLFRSNSIFPASSLPFARLTLAGEGQEVRTRGEFTFPSPLEIELESWNVPTNLIHDPLVSFTALRGGSSWLRSLKNWNIWQLGPPPDPLYFWAQDGAPQQAFVAGAAPDASNWVHHAAATLSQRFVPWLTTNGMGSVAPVAAGNGLVWTAFPFLSLYLQSLALTDGNFVFGGFLPAASTNRPFPAELLPALSARTNLVYYDWEIVGARAEALLFLGQAFRLAFNRAQLPADSAGLGWLTNAAPKLGNCVTTLAQTGPAQLSLTRVSGVGFSALELHLLADWLESPDFPLGWNTLLGSPQLPPRPQRKAPGFRSSPLTNAPPVRPSPGP